MFHVKHNFTNERRAQRTTPRGLSLARSDRVEWVEVEGFRSLGQSKDRVECRVE